jgi:hypothetical protein
MNVRTDSARTPQGVTPYPTRPIPGPVPTPLHVVPTSLFATDATMLKPASHPPTCNTCHGTGWMDGPPIPYTVGGHTHEYTTVTPCTAHWTDHDPD